MGNSQNKGTADAVEKEEEQQAPRAAEQTGSLQLPQEVGRPYAEIMGKYFVNISRIAISMARPDADVECLARGVQDLLVQAALGMQETGKAILSKCEEGEALNLERKKLLIGSVKKTVLMIQAFSDVTKHRVEAEHGQHPEQAEIKKCQSQHAAARDSLLDSVASASGIVSMVTGIAAPSLPLADDEDDLTDASVEDSDLSDGDEALLVKT